MTTTTIMTRLFKCNFNFKTSIGHHMSSFSHQSLRGPERDKGHLIGDSVVIVHKYSVSAPTGFYAHPIIHYPECFYMSTNVKLIFSRLNASELFYIFKLFLLFVTFPDHKYVFLDAVISNFQIWIISINLVRFEVQLCFSI